MERELITALLLDDKLGNLSDKSSSLLNRHIAGNYELELLANEINLTVSAVSKSLASSDTFDLPALQIDTMRPKHKTSLWLSVTAAALILPVIGMLYVWHDTVAPTTKFQDSQAAYISAQPAPVKAAGLWHNKDFRLDRLPESTLRNKARARELLKKHNIKGVLL